MAEKKPEPIIKLPGEMKTNLTNLESELERAEHAIGVLKKLGMETGALEEKLEWSKSVRETLLKEFG